MAKQYTQLAAVEPVETYIYQQKAAPVRKVKKANMRRNVVSFIKSAVKFEFWILLGCGFLVGRVAVMKQIHPLGQAFFCALLLSGIKKTYGFFTMLAILAGHYYRYGLNALPEQAAAFLFIFLFFRPNTSHRRRWHRNTRLFLVLYIIRLLAASFSRLTFYSAAVIGTETILAFLLAAIFTRGLEAILRTDKNSTQNIKQDEMFALLLLIASILSGAVGLKGYGFSIQSVLAALTIMLCSFVAGSGAGAAAGVSIAMIWGLTGEVSVLVNQWSLYGFCGLLGGIFREKGKGGTILGYLLGAVILISQMNGLDKLGFFLVENLAAAAVFALLPGKTLQRLARQVPGTFENIQENEHQQKKLKEIIAKRLTDLAEIFSRLSQSFNVEPEGLDEPLKSDIYQNIHKIIQRSCEQCQSFEICWGENFYLTYREVFELIAVAEFKGEAKTADIQGRLAKACYQQSRLVDSVNNLVQNQWQQSLWKQRIEESRQLVSGQLSGVVQLMQSLAAEIHLDAEYHHELEQAIKHSLYLKGLEVVDLSVMANKEQKILIRAEIPSCTGGERCIKVVLPSISKTTNKKFSICQKKCGKKNNTCTCELWFNPAPKYRIDHYIAKASKNGNVLSGDSHCVAMLKEGKCAVILSDGMGTGPKAAVESSTAVNLLEQLLESGLDYKFAVKMVNNILLLRSTEETFATVDLAVVDLFQAELEMLKIGAAPSYIKRQREVIRIESDSLPAGILNAVEIDPQIIPLQDGDILVMVTDGILEAVSELPSAEDWLMKLLKRIDIGVPETLATFILAMAKENYGGELRDDLSVMVLKIQEILPFNIRQIL